MNKIPVIKTDKWINSQTLDHPDYENKIILVDFWSSVNMNSRRDMQYLKKWWEDHEKNGLLILGVHSPKFEFEKDPSYLEKTITKLGIDWPVALDNDYFNWRNFGNRKRPERYIADLKGNVIYHQRGAGKLSELEQIMIGLIASKNPGKSFPICDCPQDEDSTGNMLSPNLNFGYNCGGIVNPEAYRLGRTQMYGRPRVLPEDALALEGEWLIQDEYVESVSPGARAFANFQAKEVYLVAEPAGDGGTVINMRIDDSTPVAGALGEHANLVGDVRVDEPGVYSLLNRRKGERSKLTLEVNKGGVRLYAINFYGC